MAFLLGAWAYLQESRRRRRRYAEHVHVLPLSTFRFGKGNASSEVQYWPVNSGEAPVYDVRVDLLPWEWKADDVQPLSGHVWAFVQPNTPIPTDKGDYPLLNASQLPAPSETGYQEAPIRVAFRDASGIRWRRDPDGRLSRQKRNGKWARGE